MRTGLVSVLVIGTLVTMLSAPSNAAAKSYITISPESGPPGTMVQVVGFGFRPQHEVRIELIGSKLLPTEPRHQYGFILRDEAELPPTLPLATVMPDEHVEFAISVTLPSLQEIREKLIADDNRVEIIGIAPRRSGSFLVTRAYFEMTDATLASTSVDADSSSGLPGETLWGSLGLAAIASLAIVWRSRMLR